jgi:hypothetical protein
MAHDVVLRQAADPAATEIWVRPPAEPPRRWETASGTDSIWWRWLEAPPGTRPQELAPCWYCVDDLGMGLGLYVPRRFAARAAEIDEELLKVVRLIDLDGWTRRKTGRRLYPEAAEPKAAARTRLHSGRAQLAAAGVLPWAAWPAGRLPRGWWAEPDTQVAMGAWRASAIIVRDEMRSWTRRAQGAVSLATGLVSALPRRRLPLWSP